MRELRSRPLGTAAVVLGVVAVLLAVLADELGIGGQPGFGWKQGILLAVGVIVALSGLALFTGIAGEAVKEAMEPDPSERRDEPPMPPPD